MNKLFFTLFLLVCLVGCRADPEEATIVNIGTSTETGDINDYTIIEFQDRHREKRNYHLGKIGDKFMSKPGNIHR